MAETTAVNQGQTAVAVAQPPSLLAKFASRFGVEPNKMMATLKATAFKSKDTEITNEMMMALLIVADQYGLNPWTKEIYAFPDKGGVVPVVGVDGWSRLCNENPAYDGMAFVDGPLVSGKDSLPEWIECSIFRKDRDHPTTVREYMSECRRATPPWGSHPRRMLRHKAMIQCARLAFGYVGIYDEDEAERIVEGTHTLVPESAAIAEINARISGPTTTTVTAARIVQEGGEKEWGDTPIPDSKLPGVASSGPTKLPGTNEDALAQAPTYAQIMDWINKAKSLDALDLAMSMTTHITDGTQYEELEAAAEARRKALTKK